ncbi:GNAT family N-acetyltransferase [Mumia sp. zg.B21]|uniref:GNAT family N-acetyltransferase n=1 Tax=Mumia sp. zg.B21 TaxID=2855447 RepID=UPI001C6F2C3D|nr:GNAT family N-acetyltransferase [Mumia sp. zg.B21]MBW9210875.1 GNAT family N-acetyltransferase [Mumia sp. zg.B21]
MTDQPTRATPPSAWPLPIETDRLRLRPYAHGDAPRVLDIHSRLDVIRWLGDPPFTPMASLDEARAWIDDLNELAEAHPGCLGLAAEVRDTGVVAGTVMITPCPNSDPPDLQVGWHLHPDSTGRGYATEGARALLDVAYAHFDGSAPDRPLLDEVWCGMYPDNQPSAAIAVRLGLEDLGILKDPWYEGDSHLFRTTRDHWAAARRGRPVR